MNRNQAKEILPIIQAFIDGKQIQHLYNKWEDIENLTSDLIINPELYRIKPEPTYRPFKDADECWHEILKHQPFGWVKYQCNFFQIIHVDYNSIGYGSACGTILHSKFEDIFKDSTFADGTPFGIKEE